MLFIFYFFFPFLQKDKDPAAVFGIWWSVFIPITLPVTQTGREQTTRRGPQTLRGFSTGYLDLVRLLSFFFLEISGSELELVMSQGYSAGQGCRAVT